MSLQTRISLPIVISTATARPFLKWAGGKGQLISQLEQLFPPELSAGALRRYIEPMVGGGAMFFYVAQKYPVRELHLYDVNQELILAYKAVREDVYGLIRELHRLQSEYSPLSEDGQERVYYKIRAEFNDSRSNTDFMRYGQDWALRAAQIIFLNRTCFNGLFRVNAKGEFNVPFGRYKNPQLCDQDNLMAISEVLQRTEIVCEDFEACEAQVDQKTFVYFDPPYRPLSNTASFTSYSRFEFGDKEQARLAGFYRRLHRKGAKLMLSNSDPRNTVPDDAFFDSLYEGFHISRVKATRMINCNAERRGQISEIVITNY